MDGKYFTQTASIWTQKYGKKFKMQRFTEFPAGIAAPEKVRVYRRADYFLLQWWEPSEKKNVAERVQGDLLTAIVRARTIDERLTHYRSSCTGTRRLGNQQLIGQYIEDLQQRATAGEISPATARRYASALEHYRGFVSQPKIEKRWATAASVDRKFVQELRAYLSQLQISPNGHTNTATRPLRSAEYVLDVIRSMYTWAADGQRGNLLPAGFSNPFCGNRTRNHRRAPDLFGEPDITISMACDFLNQCDCFQLRLFIPLILFGLRASEPCFIFREDLSSEWLQVVCRPGFDYDTKGLRDKRFPIPGIVHSLLATDADKHCLLFPQRMMFLGNKQPQKSFATVQEFSDDFQTQIQKRNVASPEQRQRLLKLQIRKAGGINYDQIEHEFHGIQQKLGWPSQATLKDFRHLFSTSLENSGVPLFYRKYLMGQSPGNSPIVGYTHVNELKRQYDLALERTLAPVVEVLSKRMSQLKLTQACC